MSTYLAVDAFWCGQGPGSGLSPLPGSPPHCPLLLSESLCWPEAGKPLGRRAERTVVGSGSLWRGERVGGCGVRSGLTPKASFGRSRVARRGRPGSGCLCRSPQAAAPGVAGQKGPALSVSSSSPSPSSSLSDPGSQTGAGGDCGRLAAPRAHTIVGFPALPTSGERLQGGL